MFFLGFFLCPASGLLCQSIPKQALRGEVSVEMEPLHLLPLGIQSPIDAGTAAEWALEDAARAFSDMIYGRGFEYYPGDRARMVEESIVFKPLGRVESGDGRLSIGTAEVRDAVYYLWTDYELSGEQQFRIKAWHASDTKAVNSTGYAPLHGKEGVTERAQIKEAALEDAIKKAARSTLRLTERNKPRIVRGFVALENFPIYSMFHGNWAATVKLRFRVTEIIPYSIY